MRAAGGHRQTSSPPLLECSFGLRYVIKATEEDAVRRQRPHAATRSVRPGDARTRAAWCSASVCCPAAHEDLRSDPAATHRNNPPGSRKLLRAHAVTVKQPRESIAPKQSSVRRAARTGSLDNALVLDAFLKSCQSLPTTPLRSHPEPAIDTATPRQSLLRSPATRHPPPLLCNFTQFCCLGSNHAANVQPWKAETSLQLKNQTTTQQRTERSQPQAPDLIPHLPAHGKLGNQSQAGSAPWKSKHLGSRPPGARAKLTRGNPRPPCLSRAEAATL